MTDTHSARQEDRTARAEAYLAEQRAWRAADLDRVRAYIGRLQPLLGLAHWRVRVDDDPPEQSDAYAWFACWTDQWGMTLRFADDHFRCEPEKQRDTVVHELCHALLDNLCAAVHDGYDGLDQTSRNWAWERFHREAELLVDGLARVIAPHLPLPDEESA